MRRNVLAVLLCCLVLPAGCVEERPRAGVRPLVGSDGGPSCEAISYLGCCSGQTLAYCDDNRLRLIACGPAGQCGWNAAFGLYTCGTSEQADPSGTTPRTCPSNVAQLPLADAGADEPEECRSLGYVGCCIGTELRFCSGGHVLTLDCSAQPSCGWNAGRSYYDCATTGQAEPTGRYPLHCSGPLSDGGAPRKDGNGRADYRLDLPAVDLRGGNHDAATWDGVLSLRDSAGRGEQRPHDSEGIVGLEISGLDVPGREAGLVMASDGGCASCDMGQTRDSPRGLVLLLAVMLTLANKRRKQ